eukprot:m.74926 g.74926  ORF g.74926 m.74926 type:complete len:240 (-) comp8951_c0_seq2:1082-1801(-)
MAQSPSCVLLKKEFSKFFRHPHEYVKLESLNGDNIYEWWVYIVGPPETSYAGGVWKALLRFPVDFPMSPPSVQFMGQFFHPNVYRDGKVCISTLQMPLPDAEDEGVATGFWTPVSGMETIFISILSLLSDPNPDDPANAEAAQLYTQNRPEFEKKVAATIAESLREKPDYISLRRDGRLSDYEPPTAPAEPADDAVDFGMDDDMDPDDFDFDSGDDESEGDDVEDYEDDTMDEGTGGAA